MMARIPLITVTFLAVIAVIAVAYRWYSPSSSSSAASSMGARPFSSQSSSRPVHRLSPSSPSHPSDSISRPSVSDDEWISVCITSNKISNNNHRSWTPGFIPPSYRIEKGRLSHCLSTGYYQSIFNITGWDFLSIYTPSSSEYSDSILAYGSGVVEGYSGAAMIAQSKINFYASMFNQTQFIDPITNQWIIDNLEYNRLQIKEKSSSDLFWHQVGLIYIQIEGLEAGYNEARKINPSLPALSFYDFILLNLNGDMSDIQAAAVFVDAKKKSGGRPLSNNITPLKQAQHNSHCSALIKVANNWEDVFIGHSTWGSYQTMLRVFKHYHIGFSSTPGKTVSFSSYPALLSSVDDFYVVKETHLTITETTNSVMNNTLFELATPFAVTEWVRAIVATRMSTKGNDFYQYFRRENSGTYSNQYMIFDHKLFTPGTAAPDGTFQIVSQMPGYVLHQDVTKYLRSDLYWASYNVPYFPFFYEIAGYQQLAAQYGDYYYSWDNNYRALIFRRDQHTVQSIDTMKKIMQSNNYLYDPLSRNNSGYAIAARFDLMNNDPLPAQDNGNWAPTPYGAIDSKFVSHKQVMHSGGKKPVHIYCGPSKDSLPPFQWSTSGFTSAEYIHIGMPDTFDFPWIVAEFDE